MVCGEDSRERRVDEGEFVALDVEVDGERGGPPVPSPGRAPAPARATPTTPPRLAIPSLLTTW